MIEHCQRDRLAQLSAVFKKAEPSFDSLNVKPAFQIEYTETRHKLSKISSLQSPVDKLALVHETLKITLPLEVEKYWKSCSELPADVILDIDNLQALCILLVWWSRFSNLLVECFLIGEFVSKLTKMSTKMLYLDVLKASIDFFLEMEFHESC